MIVLWILSHRQVKISVDNLALPSLFIGNGSTIDKSITVGYGFHRNYDGMVKTGKKSLHQNEELNFVLSLSMEQLKTFLKKVKN